MPRHTTLPPKHALIEASIDDETANTLGTHTYDLRITILCSRGDGPIKVLEAKVVGGPRLVEGPGPITPG